MVRNSRTRLDRNSCDLASLSKDEFVEVFAAGAGVGAATGSGSGAFFGGAEMLPLRASTNRWHKLSLSKQSLYWMSIASNSFLISFILMDAGSGNEAVSADPVSGAELSVVDMAIQVF